MEKKRYKNGNSEIEGVKNNLEYIKDYIGLVLSDMDNGYNYYKDLKDIIKIYRKLDNICKNFYKNTKIKNC